MVPTGKGLDALDRALADATVKRMRDVLLLLKRKAVTPLVGRRTAQVASTMTLATLAYLARLGRSPGAA